MGATGQQAHLRPEGMPEGTVVASERAKANREQAVANFLQITSELLNDARPLVQALVKAALDDIERDEGARAPMGRVQRPIGH